MAIAWAFDVVMASAHAEVVNMPVPARSIAASETITAADIVTKAFEISPEQKKRYVTETAGIFGMEAARRLPAGRPVLASSIQPRTSVRKGQTVPARYSDGGIEISSVFVAQEDGGLGDIIRVKNGATGIDLSARIEQDGTLRVEGN